jgi:chemotaxis protein CheD
MCHYILPHGSDGGASAARYGNVALARLLGKLLALGARKTSLEAKLFGGACVIRAFDRPGHLGSKNIDVARKFLADEGIPKVSEDVGGKKGRKLIFNVQDGTVSVKRL